MADPKTISGVRNANLRLVIECRRCSNLRAFYQSQLNRFLDQVKDMTLDDLGRRSVCGICGGRNPLVTAKHHDEEIKTEGLWRERTTSDRQDLG